MPCNKCNTDFNFLNWKLKCCECEENFCSKCLRKVEGDCVCEICEILIKRPPHRGKLMELKPKDLQQYLNKHNISTHGIVEKQELVELFYKNTIPRRKRNKKFCKPLSGSVPNIATRSQTYFNTLKNNAEAVFNSRNWNSGHSATTSPCRPAPPPPPPQRDQPHLSNSRPSAPPADSPTTSTDSYEMIPTPPPEQNYETSRVQPSPEQPKKYPKLSDFTSSEDFNDLSVKQLKELLTLNRVDYKGCVEKAELLERATRLWNDSNSRKTEESTADNLDEFCKICMDAPLDCVLLECGHMATCIECGKRLAECPICRQYVTRVVRTFKA